MAWLPIVVLVVTVSCRAFAWSTLPGASTKRPKCSHAKEVAAVKKQAALAKCYVNARAKRHSYDAACMDRVGEKYHASVEKVDNSPWCAPYYDFGACPEPPLHALDGCPE